MEVRDYNPYSWFTPTGVRKQKKRIESKGIPDMTDWRFVTVTLDPWAFENEVEGYLAGKERLRRFKAAISSYFKKEYPDIRSCWKLEFHAGGGENHGWPHWHLGLDITRKLSIVELSLFTAFWGLGRVNVQRITGPTLDYFFKYIFKDVFTGATVPDWFADHIDENGKTFWRARFWQTSPGFYTGQHLSEQSEPVEPMTCLIPLTVREKLSIRSRSVIFIARTAGGKYLVSQVTELKESKAVLFNELNRLVMMGRADLPYYNQYQTSGENLTKYIKWQTNKTLKSDRQRINQQKHTLRKLLRRYSNLNLEALAA